VEELELDNTPASPQPQPTSGASDRDENNKKQVLQLKKLWSDNAIPPEGASRPKQPIEKLSKLFQYSYVVNVWFQTKCWIWMAQIGLSELYHWVSIKQEGRSIEKLRRVYQLDFGRVPWLIDVVRGSLVVDDLYQVQALLNIVCSDPDVTVVRGKNRFVTGKKDTGYRDIQLTVRCNGFAFDALPGYNQANVGLDEDTCQKLCAEVQIHLKAFHDFKDDESHKGYTEWRAIMGE